MPKIINPKIENEIKNSKLDDRIKEFLIECFKLEFNQGTTFAIQKEYSKKLENAYAKIKRGIK